MKRNRVLPVILLTVCLCLLSLAGMSLLVSAASLDGDREAVLKAFDKMDSLASYRMKLTYQLAMTVQEKTLKVLMTGDGDVQVKPVLMQMNMKAVLDDGKSQVKEDIIQYIEESPGQITVYARENDQWTKMTMPYLQAAETDVSSYGALSGAALVKETQQVRIYDVKMDISSLWQAVEQILAASGVPHTEIVQGLLTNMTEIPFRVHVDKESGYVAKIEMNELLPVIRDAVLKLPEVPEEQKERITALFEQSSFLLSVEFSKFNDVKVKPVPDRVKRKAVERPMPGAEATSL